MALLPKVLLGYATFQRSLQNSPRLATATRSLPLALVDTLFCLPEAGVQCSERKHAVLLCLPSGSEAFGPAGAAPAGDDDEEADADPRTLAQVSALAGGCGARVSMCV